MTTLGGQSFADAYRQDLLRHPGVRNCAQRFPATAQPFFENALCGGATRRYCAGFANCTSAVIIKNTTAIRNTAVSDLWTALYKAPSWTLGRSLISQPLGAGQPSQGYTYIANSANGYGNYNALFVTYHMRDFHGVTGT